jgi:glutamate-1-semialdehyde 2,1-aminomutase
MSNILLGDISSGFRKNPFTGEHIMVKKANGALLELTDGRTLIDTFMAHGSTIIGHGDRRVTSAVSKALEDGVILGYETGRGAELAERLGGLLPGAERIRFCTSGTEAVMTALRMCRSFTGKDIVLKMDGHYNGSSDYALLNSMWSASDPAMPVGTYADRIHSSSGIPSDAAESIIPVPWNDPEALENTLAAFGDRVAAILMVPIDYNNGAISPVGGYLQFARDAATKYGTPLIFDEVLAGFKTGLSGAAGTYGVTPDVSIWSKALASGFPVSVIAGRADIMSVMTQPLPRGILQGGTHAGNIPGLAAAQATLDIISEPSFYPDLMERSHNFYNNLETTLRTAGLTVRVQGEGAGYGVYVGTDRQINSAADILRHVDQDLAKKFFTACLEEGVYFHTDFTVTSAHSDELLADLVDRAAAAAERVVKADGVRAEDGFPNA